MTPKDLFILIFLSLKTFIFTFGDFFSPTPHKKKSTNKSMWKRMTKPLLDVKPEMESRIFLLSHTNL